MAAEGNLAGHGPTAGEYIGHHLKHLQSHEQTGIVDFSVFNVDSLFWSILLGVVGLFFMWRVAKGVTAGVPGRTQAAVELLLEMVDNQAKSIIHNATSRKFVGPLALTVFVWIFLMNSMDFLPVDLIPRIWEAIYGAAGHDPHHAYMRVVPTADLSTTLGLSCGVLLVCIYYNIKIKGLGGWVHELFAAPFGDKWFLYPFNFAMQIIEFLAKTVSHGMRLFGNMYAGELLFMLIALMGGVGFASGTGIAMWIGHILAGTAWAIFHILIVALQAFIFMMLTLVYVGQAHDAH
ncbi:F0F1 ATP synthase subunit A [Methylibium petroleiphilum]|uniref:ATP synthase subunit a n=1 Tax=Methylibium petroleiphilum (strain ATCC BAA-1232 / LMG 22953 / PM1) TaxID=420662 RepID=A2SC64_METPP|nr:F0F1 ATP synthase subunit A [Methylibium petroleiphilum]ABM93153.1 F0-ATP synthase, a subunit [Methylibium petroleiphilum PM1]